ncbi:CheY-like protein [Schizopora paradoxa]|uniref:CheY-like protein n=1 Tax=Schizopora paradoxa TaxID=27342 RepID=A0A0H2S5F4_9AGAM|nr:CheY-like protein [Schizopora paradoxa]
MIVRNITCDRDSNRKYRKRSRSLDDGHLLPEQGTKAAAHTALPGRSFADKAGGRQTRRPAFVWRGTSDVSGILKRWRTSATLPPSSTTLGFSLPQPSFSNTPAFSRKATSTMELGKGLHVLVVDDDILTRKLMERSLARMGCAVDTAENGQVALEMIASADQARSNWTSGRYDIVFLDNQMPVMSGLDAVSTLRSFRRGDLVIGVTGNALLSDRQEFLSAGADHVLTKPVFEGNLVEVMRVAQERRVQMASS